MHLIWFTVITRLLCKGLVYQVFLLIIVPSTAYSKLLNKSKLKVAEL